MDGLRVVSSAGLLTDVRQNVVNHLAHHSHVVLREVRLHGEVARKLNVCNGVDEFVLMSLDVLPLTIIPSVAMGPKNLHRYAFLFHEVDESVRFFSRQPYKMKLHGVAKRIDLLQRHRNLNVRVVVNERMEQVPVFHVNLFDGGQSVDLGVSMAAVTSCILIE